MRLGQGQGQVQKLKAFRETINDLLRSLLGIEDEEPITTTTAPTTTSTTTQTTRFLEFQAPAIPPGAVLALPRQAQHSLHPYSSYYILSMKSN